MLPLGSDPVIRYSVQEALQAGCDPIVVVRSPDDQDLKKYLNDQYSGRVKLATQPEPRGLADALLKGYRALDTPGRCAVLLPDNVVLNGTGIGSLLTIDVAGSILGTISVSEEEAAYFGNSGDYTAVPSDGSRSAEVITGLQPKGDGSFYDRKSDWPARRTVPRYCLTDTFFDKAENRSPDPVTGEIDDVPILRTMVNSETVYAVPVDGEVYDMGTPKRYTRLNCVIHNTVDQ
jgi:UTP-glucose-1-phosphate uridylyltransferase